MKSNFSTVEQSVQFLENFYLSTVKNKKILQTVLGNEILSPLHGDLQEKILHSTVQNPICKKYPPSRAYQRFFLRTLIDFVESHDLEICDSLVEEYSAIFMLPSGDEIGYCSYVIDEDCRVSLQENSCFVAKSTTGLLTWEASKYLVDWCRENVVEFENKKVLELGSGIGLLGISILKLCHPCAYTFSDKSWEVLNVLASNIAINYDEIASDTIIQKMQLVWSTISKEDSTSLSPDIIIGADLVYDPSMVESLTHALKTFLSEKTVCAYIANTVRSTDTIQVFESALGSLKLTFEIMNPPMKSSFIYNEPNCFKLYKIYMKEK
ncbi:protein-lysine N-methyltransferase EEF2KMT-like [Uloborus diversus]|uniref:protein-lysine N-methyltransferase EEF2KMT-like n=1 Tax=Uloborus diversus TaxID=327109 RepID=UPI0024090794|nr:protein-lysine N-methyltransferase EEF2KMT-like [Uloborus diversus]